MITIKAIVRNGRIETDEPLDLPDGTELVVMCPAGQDGEDDKLDDSPEAVEAWGNWHDSVQASENKR